MKKVKSLFKVFVLIMLINSCGKDKEREFLAYQKAENLVSQLGNESVLQEFSEKNFNKNEVKRIFQHLADSCNAFQSECVFIKSKYTKVINNNDKINFIYKLPSACDTFRFVLTYELNDDPLLLNMYIEPISVPENKVY